MVKASTRLFKNLVTVVWLKTVLPDALMVGHKSQHSVCWRSAVQPPARTRASRNSPFQALPSCVLNISQPLCTPGSVWSPSECWIFFSFYLTRVSLVPTCWLSPFHPVLLGRALSAPSRQAIAEGDEVSASLSWTDPTCLASPFMSCSPALSILVASAGLTGLALGAKMAQDCRWGPKSAEKGQGSPPLPCWLHSC